MLPVSLILFRGSLLTCLLTFYKTAQRRGGLNNENQVGCILHGEFDALYLFCKFIFIFAIVFVINYYTSKFDGDSVIYLLVLLSLESMEQNFSM